MLTSLLLGVALAAEPPMVPPTDAQLWRPPFDATHSLWTEDSSLPPTLEPAFRLSTGWTHAPLVYANHGEQVMLLGDALGVHLSGGLALQRVRLAVDLPLYPVLNALEGGGGAGDLGLDLKGVATSRLEAPLGLALGARVSLPTSTTRAPVGFRGPTWTLTGIADAEIVGFVLAANVGIRRVPRVWVPGLELTSGPHARLGIGRPLGDQLGLSLDLAGQTTWRHLFDGSTSPAEVLVGGWFRDEGDRLFQLGLGTGLTPGVGAARFRLVASMHWDGKQPLGRIRAPAVEGRAEASGSEPTAEAAR